MKRWRIVDTDFSKARELFTSHDGSAFYMDRDDVRSEYLSYGVPERLEQVWMGLLVERYLASIDEPGNWRSVNFFCHHSDPTHLDVVLDAEPRGEWWERCAFLEQALLYLDLTCRDHHPADRLAAGCRLLADRAARLAAEVPPDQPPKRAADLLVKCGVVERSFM